MAKGGAGKDISEWVGSDIVHVKDAFKRGVKTGAAASGGGDVATLSALKKFISTKAYNNVQAGAFTATCRNSGGKMPLNTFVTQEWFLKMAGGKQDDAIQMCKHIVECECKAKAKDEQGPKKDSGVTGRLTDTKNYTGSHQARFGEDGKGKGMDGRCDKTDGSGYVGGYKGAGTYGTKK